MSWYYIITQLSICRRHTLAAKLPISFSSNRDGSADVFIKPADGSGEAESLLATPAGEWGSEWSADGKYLVGSGSGKLWYLRAEEGGSGYEKVMFLDTPFDAPSPDLSPDAKFLAYQSTRISILTLVRRQYTPALPRIPRLSALNPAHHLRR